jgi:hypothetical protein
MYYGGRPEPVNPVMAALGAAVGAVAGLVTGYIGFLLATIFPHMLHTALPGMTGAWFFALWAAALTIPLLWFRTVFAGGRGLGTKVFACCGIAIVIGLFAGELTGLVRVFPWGQRFYLVPAVDRPAAAPLRR